MLVHKKIAIIILSSIIHLFIQQNILLKKRRKKNTISQKKHIFFKEPHDIFFFGVSKSHPPSSLTKTSHLPYHHPTIFFLDPPTLVRALQSWVRFPIHDRSETTSGRPTWRFFFGNSWRTSKGLQMGKMGPVQNKWSLNKWSVSLGVFLFHPTYVKVTKLFHRPLYNWRPILWHFDVGKLLESWDPRGTKFLK